MGITFETIGFGILLILVSSILYIVTKKTKFSDLPYYVQQTIIGICFFAVSALSTIYTDVSIREASISTAGLLFGGTAGVIAAILSSLICFLPSVDAFISLSAAINIIVLGLGCAMLRRYMFDNKKPSWQYSLASGIVSEVLYLLLIFICHMGNVRESFSYVSTTGIAIIIVNGLSAMLTGMVISKLAGEKLFPHYKRQQISVLFQRWLLVCVGISLVATSVFTILLQSSTSWADTNEILTLNLADVQQDISDTSDDNLLTLATTVGNYIDQIGVKNIDNERLIEISDEVNASEINIIDIHGYIIKSTYSSFIGFDMRSGEQSMEFANALLDQKEQSYVQSYQATAHDSKLNRKYAAVTLQDGGFVQVGYDAETFHTQIDHIIHTVTKNRHIGNTGGIIIFDESFEIISGKSDEAHPQTPGSSVSQNVEAGKRFQYDVYGVPSYCMYQESEGYYIVAYIPKSEANFDRNFSLYIMIFMEILIFAGLFIRLYFLIKGVVVDNIKKVTDTLGEITDGDLNVSVNVRNSDEFASLSDDINEMVDTLKNYIDAAAARIDKELEFARVIQHSVLPTVFLNNQNLDIYADMNAAKEVGGDFYDFYFVDPTHVVFLVADVSGKGIPAAMFMMQAKALMKGYAESGLEVDEILTNTNNKLCEGNEAEMFVTAWIGKVNIETGELTYACAGHNPPLLKDREDKFNYLKFRPGLVLAGMEGIHYKKNTIHLSQGDMLYLYTDGVTEATTADNRLYGEERLQEKLNENVQMSPEEIIKMVQSDINAFVEDSPQFDDITMLCLKYIGDSNHE